MTGPVTTLGDVIHQRAAAPIRAERRIARALFAGNPMAGFDTLAGRAARSDASGPTVLRLANGIGFAGHADVQRPEGRTA